MDTEKDLANDSGEPWGWITSERWLARHRNAFILIIGGLTLANIVTGGWWWSFWPLFGWGIVFFFHLCLVRSLHIEPDWVEERANDIRLRSYDLGHIDSIEERYQTAGPLASASRRARRYQLSAQELAYPIVDAHHHLWDLERNYHPWLRDEPLVAGRHGDYRRIRRTYLPTDFRRDWAGLNVVASVHVEAEWDRDDEVGETRWVSEMNDRYGLPQAIVAHARLDDPGVAGVLAQHAAYPLVRGIRHKPAAAPDPASVRGGAPGSMSDPAWRRGYALLREHGLAFDLQVPYWHLGEAAELARDHPQTLLIVNHTGLPSQRSPEGLAAWREGMHALAGCRNVVVKISGLGEPHLAPWSLERHYQVVRETIEIFGADRCMFASNYPVERLYAPYFEIMRTFMQMTADLPLRERRWLFRDNAAEYYRIPL